MPNWKLASGLALLLLALSGCAVYPAGPPDTYYYEPVAPAYAPSSSVGVYYYSGGSRYYRDRNYHRGHYHGSHRGKHWR